jgi:RNA polymerase II subunit A-like phosphatase
VKLTSRPGLQNFLDTMSELYEMHVYTMGTRTYADAICRVIDPEGKIFGGRILSRDESGSGLFNLQLDTS